MNNIIREYINKYGIRDNESEEKRVRNLVKKIKQWLSMFFAKWGDVFGSYFLKTIVKVYQGSL